MTIKSPKRASMALKITPSMTHKALSHPVPKEREMATTAAEAQKSSHLLALGKPARIDQRLPNDFFEKFAGATPGS